MTYFEFYELPVSFHPDASAVKRRYYELSRKYHPDHFTQADNTEQADILQMAAMNNLAYNTLRDRDATMAYILKMYGLLEDEEKYKLPPDFLMEMMDLNEAISDYEDQPENGALKAQIIHDMEEQLKQWANATEILTTAFNKGEQLNESLLKIKDSYFRKKYLLRIKERIG